MAQRTDQRDATKVELDCYNKILKLTDHVMSICKPKDENVNNHHIPKKNINIGKLLTEACVECGADILEANENFYVGKNLEIKARLANYQERINLQKHAIRLTFRMEHMIRVLHFNKPFAESTIKYFMDLLCEARALLIKWRDSEVNMSKQLVKELQDK